MPPLDVDWSDPRATLLALLFCGHACADFVFQSRWMVEHKGRSLRALLAHGGTVLFVQALFVLAYVPSVAALPLLAAVALLHVAIDALKVLLERLLPRLLLWWFALDQALHALVLVAVWAWWPSVTPWALDATEAVGRGAVLLAVVAFNRDGGSAVVARMLELFRAGSADDPGAAAPEPDAGDGLAGAGRLIGFLERLVVLILVALDQWGAVGLVLTAKSVARFKRLGEQPFAEIYLIGTLTSLTVAMVSGLFLGWIL